MRTLIERLFADRTAEKRESWCRIFDDQEILTVDAAAHLGIFFSSYLLLYSYAILSDDSAWLRLNLPLGVMEVLKDAMRPKDETHSALTRSVILQRHIFICSQRRECSRSSSRPGG